MKGSSLSTRNEGGLVLKLSAWVFSAIGLALLVAVAAISVQNLRFAAQATRVQGEIVDIRVSASQSGELLFKPIVAYQVDNGKVFQHVPMSSSSNSDTYIVGGSLPILYAPDDPAKSQIDGLPRWVLAIILGTIGTIFTFIGVIALYAAYSSRIRADRLRKIGKRIRVGPVRVEQNMGLSVNGQSPWVIVADWLSPTDGRLRRITSENLWFDPSPYLESEEMDALIDPQNHARHILDTAFLAKLHVDA